VVDARNGKLLFTFDSDGVPTIIGQKAFLTPSDSSGVEGIHLQAVNSSTGAQLWSRRPAGKYGSIVGPSIATSKVVYVTTNEGWVLGYSTATGKQVWTGHAGGTVNPQVDHPKNEGSAIGGGVLAVSATNRLAVFG
jgi:outer membrane protein assembly factor BamB